MSHSTPTTPHSPATPEPSGAFGPFAPAAIFWDMDGTLVNSEPLWGEAMYYLASLMGHSLTPKERAQTIGAAFPDMLRYMAGISGVELTEEDAAYYKAQLFSKIKDLFAQRLTMFPGVRVLLAELRRAGVPMLVTTNTQREVADSAITAIGREFFTDTICGDEVPQGKPAPDMYFEAARRVGADPQQCLVFEDSTAGMTAALAAGCRVIGLPETEEITVPDGAVPITSLRGSAHRHLDGAQAADVFAWWERLPAFRG